MHSFICGVYLMNSYADNPGPFILAHRGGAGEAPENTLEAFQYAVDSGSTYLETDVRLAGDGRLYLAHGSTSWMPNQPLKLPSGQPPMTLEALIRAFPDCYFAIDPKHSLAVEPLAQLIVDMQMESRVCIGSSFDNRAAKVAELVEKRGGKRPALALVGAPASLKLLLSAAGLPLTPRYKDTQFIHIHKSLLTRAAIDAAHRQSLKVIAWVVNDRQTMRKLLDWKVDGFMTDFPSVASEIVEP